MLLITYQFTQFDPYMQCNQRLQLAFLLATEKYLLDAMHREHVIKTGFLMRYAMWLICSG